MNPKLKGVWLSCPQLRDGRGYAKFPAHLKADYLTRLQLFTRQQTVIAGAYEGNLLDGDKRMFEVLYMQLDLMQGIGWVKQFEWLGMRCVRFECWTGHAEYTIRNIISTLGGWWIYRPDSTFTRVLPQGEPYGTNQL